MVVPTLQSIFTGSCRTDGTLDHDATLLPAKLPSAEQEPAFSLAEKGTDGTIQITTTTPLPDLLNDGQPASAALPSLPEGYVTAHMIVVSYAKPGHEATRAEEVIVVLTVEDGQKKASLLPAALPHLELAKTLSRNWVNELITTQKSDLMIPGSLTRLLASHPLESITGPSTLSASVQLPRSVSHEMQAVMVVGNSTSLMLPAASEVPNAVHSQLSASEVPNCTQLLLGLSTPDSVAQSLNHEESKGLPSTTQLFLLADKNASNAAIPFTPTNTALFSRNVPVARNESNAQLSSSAQQANLKARKEKKPTSGLPTNTQLFGMAHGESPQEELAGAASAQPAALAKRLQEVGLQQATLETALAAKNVDSVVSGVSKKVHVEGNTEQSKQSKASERASEAIKRLRLLLQHYQERTTRVGCFGASTPKNKDECHAAEGALQLLSAVVADNEKLMLRTPESSYLQLQTSQKENAALEARLVEAERASVQLRVVSTASDVLLTRLRAADAELEQLRGVAKTNERLVKLLTAAEADGKANAALLSSAAAQQKETSMQLAAALTKTEQLHAESNTQAALIACLRTENEAAAQKLHTAETTNGGLTVRLTAADAAVLQLQAEVSINEGLRAGLAAAHSENEQLQLALKTNEGLATRLAAAEAASAQLPALAAANESLLADKRSLHVTNEELVGRLRSAEAEADGLRPTAATAAELAEKLKAAQATAAELQERTSVAERTLGANQARLDRLQAETDGVKHELQAALVQSRASQAAQLLLETTVAEGKAERQALLEAATQLQERLGSQADEQNVQVQQQLRAMMDQISKLQKHLGASEQSNSEILAELRQLQAEFEYYVARAKQTEATLQAQGAQKERVCGQLAQRLQAAGETIAAHEQAARGLTQEMQAVCADNAAREGMCGALMGDLESANATIAAHEQAANNLKAYLAQLQDRNVQLEAEIAVQQARRFPSRGNRMM